MSEYIVKPGDTLSKIATGTLGVAGKWRIIAGLNGIVNPNKIRVGQRLQLPEEVTEVPSVVNTSAGVRAVSKERVRISVENKVVYATLLAKPEKIFVGGYIAKACIGLDCRSRKHLSAIIGKSCWK